MKPMIKGSLCAGALLVAATLAGATTLEEIESVQAGRLDAGKQSQDRIDDIVKETDSLETEYKQVLKELEGLKVFNTLMQRQIDRQESDIGKLNEAIDEVEATGRQMLPLMVRMIEALDLFVEADAPFLLDERRTRVGSLYELMEREDVTVAEKFRKVLEAYQIENDYGRTIEAYKASVEHEGATLGSRCAENRPRFAGVPDRGPQRDPNVGSRRRFLGGSGRQLPQPGSHGLARGSAAGGARSVDAAGIGAGGRINEYCKNDCRLGAGPVAGVAPARSGGLVPG